MKIAAAKALAELAREDPDEVAAAYSGRRPRYDPDYIIPVPFDPRLISAIRQQSRNPPSIPGSRRRKCPVTATDASFRHGSTRRCRCCRQSTKSFKQIRAEWVSQGRRKPRSGRRSPLHRRAAHGLIGDAQIKATIKRLA